MKTVLPTLSAIALFITCGSQLEAVPIQNGEAFIYPESLHGQRLASGEIFRHDRMTAGHPTIPVGTVVRVTNLSNRLGIDVLINDRLTGAQSGIMLSQSAASMLGIRRGTRAMVRVETLGHPVARGCATQTVPARSPSQPPHSGNQSVSSVKNALQGLYFLEFATYGNIVQATILSKKLTGRGAPSRVVQDQQGKYHVISDGFFTSIEDASGAWHLVSRNVGYTPVIKQI